MAAPLHPLQMRMELQKDDLIRVIGPAKVSIVDGCIRVLGVDLCRGDSAVVNRYRSYCLKAVSQASVHIMLGEGGSVEKPNQGEEVIDVWESTTRDVVSRGGLILVLGAVESGKTSFSTLVANIALDQKKKPCIIDADVGQGDLAPPTFIGMKCFDRKTLWLREEKGDVIKFVGYLTPSHAAAMARVITAVVELSTQARAVGGDPIVINTDGWLGDSVSIEYKYLMARSLSPTSIVVLGHEFCGAFQTMFRNSSVNIYCLPKPKVVRERSREDRRDLRKYNYQKWFANLKRVCLDVDSISISGICSLNGIPVPSEEVAELEKKLGVRILHMSRFTDFDVVVIPDSVSMPRDVLEHLGLDRRIIFVRPSNAKGLIASVVDRMFSDRGIAIVEEIDFTSKKICFSTDYMGEIGGLVVGKVKLDDQWYDSARHHRCLV